MIYTLIKKRFFVLIVLFIFIFYISLSGAITSLISSFAGEVSIIELNFTENNNQTVYINIPLYARISSFSMDLSPKNASLAHYYNFDSDAPLIDRINSLNFAYQHNGTNYFNELNTTYTKLGDGSWKFNRAVTCLNTTPLSNTSGTINFWVNISSWNNNMRFAGVNATPYVGLWIPQTVNDNPQAMFQSETGVINNGYNAQLLEWSMYTIRYNQTGFEVFWNATQVDSRSITTWTDWNHTSYFCIGSDTNDQVGNDAMEGFMDDLSIWNTHISYEKISELWNSAQGKPAVETGDTVMIDYIDIGQNEEYDWTSSAYLTENQTIIINSTGINNILDEGCTCDNCTIIDEYCQMPFLIHSLYGGDLEISNLNITYDYGVEDCDDDDWNYTIMNITYIDENTLLNISASNQYGLTVSEPFTQNIAGTFSLAREHTFCTNINLTQRNISYEIYGSLNIQSTGYETKIMENDVFNPYVVETVPYYPLQVYLISLSNASKVEFTVKEFIRRNTLPDVQVEMYQYINGSLFLVNSKLTNIVGEVVFDYIPDKQYLINFSKGGYNPLSTNFNPITSSTYDVYMTTSTIQNTTEPMSKIIINIDPETFEEGDNNIPIQFISPYSEFNSYSYLLEYEGGNVSDSGSSRTGETFLQNFTIVNPSITDTVKLTVTYDTDLTGEIQKIYSYEILVAPGNYTMMRNKDQTYGLGLLERLLISVFCVLLVIGIATLIGQFVAGCFIGFSVFGGLVYIGFIPLWSILISILVGLIIISGRSD